MCKYFGQSLNSLMFLWQSVHSLSFGLLSVVRGRDGKILLFEFA